MSFYDRSDATPFLPRLVIFNILRVVNSRLPLERYFGFCYLSCNWVSVIVWTYNGKICWMTVESILCAYLIISWWERNTGNICSVFSLPLVCELNYCIQQSTYIGEKKYFGWQVASARTILVSWWTWRGYGWAPWVHWKDTQLGGCAINT